MKKKILALLIIVLTSVFGLITITVTDQTKNISNNSLLNSNSYKSINSRELASLMSTKKFVFVNVHIPYEGEIKKTDLFIPYNEIGKNMLKLPKDKNAKIILYCRSGRMSEEAAQVLTKSGYTNVYNLTGGMISWEENGYTLLRK